MEFYLCSSTGCHGLMLMNGAETKEKGRKLKKKINKIKV
jgi:hypothetical protein